LIAKGAATTLLITLTGLLLIFIIGLIFSIIGSVIIFYGFTLSRRGEDLHRSYGLLTHRASSLPRRRIQVLEVEEKMLRRLFGLATLRADTAGSHREHEDDNEGRDVLIPIVRRSEVDELLPVVFPDLNSDGGDWQRVSKLAVRRWTIKGSLVCFVSAIVLIILHRELLALYFLVFIPLVYLINVVNYRNLGYLMGERYFRTRHGWLGRSTHIVPVNKIQAIEIHQSPFDRRLDLATLSIDTAGQAYTGRGPRISNVPIGEAKAIAEMLAHKAAVTFYRW